MQRIAIGLLLLVLAAPTLPASTVWAQTTKPASPSRLEVRALTAFYSGDYVAALPLLIKVSQQLKDQPRRLEAIQEKIRVCQRNLSNQPLNPVADSSDIKTSPEERRPHSKPKNGEILHLAIKELGNFEYNPDTGGNLPPDIQRLAGATIRTHGYMIPLDQADNITQFTLVPSLFACCFGQPPQIQHTLLVRAPKGKAVAYTPDEIVVEGVLTVEEKKEDGIITSLFEIECTSVRAAAR